MIKSIKVITICAVTLIALLLYLSKDDDLNAEAQAMLNSVDWQTPTDSFLYFLGIDTQLGMQPLDEGARILTEIRTIEQSYSNLQSIDELVQLRERAKINLSGYDDLCDYSTQASCLNQLFSNIDEPLQSSEAQAIKQRFLTFISMDDFRAMTQPHILETFGPFSALVTGNRLVNLEAISLARKSHNDSKVAIDQLYELLAHQRRYLLDTDSLIARMVAYSLVNETTDIISLLLRQYDITGKPIQPLSKQELSLETVINREFKFVVSALDFVTQQSEYNAWPTWIWTLGFKKKMTINQAMPHYKSAILASQSKQNVFRKTESAFAKSWFRNAIGTQLNQTSLVDFSDYIARGFDLNVKISLFNSVLNKPINPQNLPELKNPYYDNIEQAFLSDDKTRVCMGGPLDDERMFRCIPFKLKPNHNGTD